MTPRHLCLTSFSKNKQHGVAVLNWFEVVLKGKMNERRLKIEEHNKGNGYSLMNRALKKNILSISRPRPLE